MCVIMLGLKNLGKLNFHQDDGPTPTAVKGQLSLYISSLKMDPPITITGDRRHYPVLMVQLYSIPNQNVFDDFLQLFI